MPASFMEANRTIEDTRGVLGQNIRGRDEDLLGVQADLLSRLVDAMEANASEEAIRGLTAELRKANRQQTRYLVESLGLGE